MKKEHIDNLGFFIQAVLLGATVISLITTFFIGPLYILTDGLVALLLLTMSYNNYKFYQRKHFTILYLVIGIAWLILTIVEAFHGV